MIFFTPVKISTIKKHENNNSHHNIKLVIAIVVIKSLDFAIVSCCGKCYTDIHKHTAHDLCFVLWYVTLTYHDSLS